MSTATSTTGDTADGDSSTDTVGSFRACWWALEQIASSPVLLLVMVLLGALRAVSASAGTENGDFLVTLPFELYLTAVIYGYVGLTYGEFYDVRDVLLRSAIGGVRLWLLSIALGLALVISMVVLLPFGYLGLFVFLLVWVLLFVNVLLLGPAVCIDEGVISAIEKGWALADEARWTVLGILVLTWGPILTIHASLDDPAVVTLAAAGLGFGFFNCIVNLALGRLYIGQRSKLANA